MGFSADGGFGFDDLNSPTDDAPPPPRPPLPRPEDYFSRNAPPHAGAHADPHSPTKENGPPPYVFALPMHAPHPVRANLTLDIGFRQYSTHHRPHNDEKAPQPFQSLSVYLTPLPERN